MMGERAQAARTEADALRLGIDLGMTLIDTAEMYADGGAERVVAKAIAGQRHKVFLVSKVLPDHATRAGTVAACEASLRRLNTDHLDLYLLHWRGAVPLAHTLEGLEALRVAGKIRRWGVSNLDIADMGALAALPEGGRCATNQVLYNLTQRGIEYDLLPWCRARGLPVMAYSPLDQGRLCKHPALAPVAARHGVGAAQIALAWLLRQPGVIVIPKAARAEHVRQNRAAADIALTEQDLAALERAFPPPRRAQPLAML